MKRVLLIVVAGLWVLSACNTFEGLGKDVQKAGETIEGAAKKK
ncbi:MAG: entericidin A/B family lipoprotein [Pseudomonadota bacterium]